MKLTSAARTASFTALICVFTGAACAHAEDTMQAADVYVTATRAEKELQDVPMSVTVMTADDIQRSGARTVGELLEDVPGVQIQNDGSQGLKRVSIRGEDAFRTLVLIDGQKISEHKSMSGSPMLIDASRIERIEVIKGPASVLYGSDAIGGVVNIITKKGGEKPIEGEIWTGFSGASRGFSEGMAVRGNLDGFKYSLSGSHSDQGNIHTPEGELSNTNFRQTDASAFISYDFSEHVTVGAGLDYYKGAFNSTSMNDNTGGNRFFVNVPKWARTKYYFFAEGKDISEYFSRIRFDAYYQKNEKDMRNYVGQADGPGSTNMSGRPVSYLSANVVMDNYAHNIIRSRGFSLQTDWQLGANHYLIAGYELNDDRLNSDGKTYLNNNIAVSPQMSIVINKATSKFYNGNQLSQALFASMESRLPKNFALTYGVRLTHVRTELTRGEEVSNPYTGTMHMGPMSRPMFDNSGETEKKSLGKDTNFRPVFNVALVWTGIEDLALRLSWAQGFRVPNLTEKYIGTAMGGGTIYGNPNLNPETSNNFEAGARYNHGSFNLDAAIFCSLADNYIASVLTQQGSGVYTYTNVADATTFGSEISASYLLATEYGSFTPYFSLTWMRRRYDDGAGWKTFDTATPEWVSRYGVRYAKAIAENVSFHADVYGRSQSETIYSTAQGSSDYSLGGFTTANMALGFDFGKERRFSVLAELLNIFDKRYQYNPSILEPGLHANVKLSYKF